ncbi:unnamed protein product [Euphydryas editha]|uniref:Uncharacterized protein n=1 Tax=Euphydryas editha TaxID=104508 RepID=A0AAU9U724_EUPED|nr:unnamed protein product [Euphydryas editha]
MVDTKTAEGDQDRARWARTRGKGWTRKTKEEGEDENRRRGWRTKTEEEDIWMKTEIEGGEEDRNLNI